MDVGINDLSFQFPFATERQAVDALENLAAMCLELESENVQRWSESYRNGLKQLWNWHRGKHFLSFWPEWFRWIKSDI